MLADILDFHGTPYEIGFQHGKQLAEVIHKSVVPYVENDMKEKGISPNQLLDAISTYESLIEKSFPEVIQETKGLADGAGFEYEKALLVLLFWEVRDTVEHELPACSSFVAAGEATHDGTPIAVQNIDWSEHILESNMAHMFRIKPKGKYSFAGLGFAGNLGRSSVVGFNEKGLCFVGSGIRQMRGAGFGFPPLISTRLGIERCATVDEYIELVKSIPNWGHAGENVDVVDMDGNLARIGYTTDRAVIVQTKNHFLVSTNHYHDLEFRDFGPDSPQMYASSYARYERINKLLRDNYGHIDTQKTMEIMSDHDHGTKPPEGNKSICRHGVDHTTLWSIVMDPSNEKIWVSNGSPCKKDFLEFKI